MAALTSGNNNVGVGANALNTCTQGVQNIALGAGALQNTVLDGNNIAVGQNALSTVGIFSRGGGNNSGNVCVGASALGNADSVVQNNVVVGISGLVGVGSSTTVVSNTIIGTQAGAGFITGSAISNNILIGYQCGLNLTNSGSPVNYNTFIGGYRGPVGAPGNSIAISDGQPYFLMDCHLSKYGTFSFSSGSQAVSLHVYNSVDVMGGPITNYERGGFDWLQTANVFRLLSQAGGTGTIRLIAYDAFSKAGAPAATDLPAGTCAFIDDTTNNQTWLVFNKAGTVRKVQLT
jgi:hypothetical protein